MKIVGLARMPRIIQDVKVSPNHMLPNVTSLDLSFNSFAGDNSTVRRRKAIAFAVMLPNLEEMDLSHTTNVPGNFAPLIGRLQCPKLHRLVWKSSQHRLVWKPSQQDILINDGDLPQALTEANLDSSRFRLSFRANEDSFIVSVFLLVLRD